MSKYKHSCHIDNAPKFAGWIAHRGGVANWHSVNLSNPGASWSSPAKAKDGTPMPKPTWQAGNEPEVITKAEDIEVFTAKEVKRFRVGIRRAGFMLKCTDGASRRIRAAVAKAGEGAYHELDYSTQEAVIMQTTSLGSLKDWVKGRLEALRKAIEAENISYGEVAELEGLAPFIDKDDVQLLQWAGVTEEEYERRQAE